MMRFMYGKSHVLEVPFSGKKKITGNIPGDCYSDVPKLHFLRSKILEKCFIESEPLPFLLFHIPVSFEILLNTVAYLLPYLSSSFTAGNGVYSMKCSLYRNSTLFFYEIEGKMSWLTYFIPNSL